MFDTKLPDGWALASIDEVTAYVQRGKSPKYTEHSSLPVINQKCIRWHGLVKGPARYIHEDQIHKWDAIRYLQKGDLLWNSTGTGTIGRACLYANEFPKAVVDSHVTIVRSNRQAIEPSYLRFFVMSPFVQANFKEMQSGSTNQVELGKLAILETEIPLPPLPEQERIVEKIETLFAEINKGEEALREVQKLLARYRQSVLKAAVTGELTADWRKANSKPTETGHDLLARILKRRRETWQSGGKYKEPIEPEAEGLPNLPDQWAWTGIETLCPAEKSAIKAGPFGSSLKKSDYSKAGYKIYGQEQVIAGDSTIGDYYINQEKFDELQNCAVKPEDVLISLVGTVGKVLILPEGCQKGVINPRLVKLTLDRNAYLPRFFSIYFGSAFLKSLYSLETHGATMDVLNLGIIKRLPFPVCSIAEQEEICERVEEAFNRIRILENWCRDELRRSTALRQSILKDAFSGKLVPQDPSDEPAEKLLKRIRAVCKDRPKRKRKKAKE